MTNDSEFINHRTYQHEWTADFIAGWVSGAVSILACQPVDTILTRWQAASPIQSVLITTGTTSVAGKNNWRDITLDLYRTAGPRSLWRGASPVIVAAPIQNALLMGGYGFGSRWFSGSNVDVEKPSLSRSKQLGAIFVGGCTGGKAIERASLLQFASL
jgi:solute carrier family 25 (mitochondrial carnitine/acylcarnitine transporter), member 20/29